MIGDFGAVMISVLAGPPGAATPGQAIAVGEHEGLISRKSNLQARLATSVVELACAYLKTLPMATAVFM